MRAFLSAYHFDNDVDLDNMYPFNLDDKNPMDWQAIVNKPYTILTPFEVAAARGAYLVNANTKALSRGRDTYIKTHTMRGAVSDYPLIPKELTKAAIYIVRDPRDVAVSYARHLGKTIDEIIETMSSRESALVQDDSVLFQITATWSDNVHSWTLDTQDIGFDRCIVRYEDMIEAPGREFRHVVEFLGWDYDVDRLQRAIDRTAFSVLKAKEERDGFKEKSRKNDCFFNKGRVGTWRDVLTEDQERRISETHNDMMVKYGYKHGSAEAKAEGIRLGARQGREPESGQPQKLAS